MKKQIIAILLLLSLSLGLMPQASLAAGSVSEALGEVNIYNGGQELKYLSVSGAVRR